MEKINDYMMLFRFEPRPDHRPTDTEKAEQKKSWGSWIGSIAAKAKLVSISQLGFSGKQLRSDMTVSDGMNISDNKTLGGNMIVKAGDMDEALEMAKGCPILHMGGTVEIRDIIPM